MRTLRKNVKSYYEFVSEYSTKFSRIVSAQSDYNGKNTYLLNRFVHMMRIDENFPKESRNYNVLLNYLMTLPFVGEEYIKAFTFMWQYYIRYVNVEKLRAIEKKPRYHKKDSYLGSLIRQITPTEDFYNPHWESILPQYECKG